jgi:CrcB protein
VPVVAGVALGGALGASVRYLLDRFVEERSGSLFPWSTFLINISGCLVIGVLAAALVDRHHIPAWIRVGLIMGVVGGYTTFSTFSQETLGLVDAHDFGVALGYVAGSVVLGVTAVYAGGLIGRNL